MRRQKISRHEELRRTHGYSTTALAKALGLSHSYVSQIEGGTLAASSRYRRAFCELLDVPEEAAFPNENETTTSTAPSSGRTPNRVVAYHLWRLRKERGWTQAVVTERLSRRGVTWSVPSLGMAERSRDRQNRGQRFDADQIVAFADVFGVPVIEFFKEPGSESPGSVGGNGGAVVTFTG